MSGKALQWVLPLPSIWEPAFQGGQEAGLARDPPREVEGKPLPPGPEAVVWRGERRVTARGFAISSLCH